MRKMHKQTNEDPLRIHFYYKNYFWGRTLLLLFASKKASLFPHCSVHRTVKIQIWFKFIVVDTVTKKNSMLTKRISKRFINLYACDVYIFFFKCMLTVLWIVWRTGNAFIWPGPRRYLDILLLKYHYSEINWNWIFF